ncbi:MAG TPA: hypothetical protein VMV95_01320 [Bacillota bacterium]|nr:hypothetical protein [Bacillota bacterium]
MGKDEKRISGCPWKLELGLYRTWLMDENKMYYFLAINHKIALKYVKKMKNQGYNLINEEAQQVGTMKFRLPREDVPYSPEIENGTFVIDLGVTFVEGGDLEKKISYKRI